MINKIPLKKMGSVEDFAKAVVYLSDNDAANFVKGTEIRIDGGMILRPNM